MAGNITLRLVPGDAEPRLPAGKEAAAAAADRWVPVALDAIETCTDPEAAERLLADVQTVAGAVQVRKLGEARLAQWRRVKLLAERKYGELLPPPQQGQPLSSGKKSTPAEQMGRNKARRVAAVDPEEFRDYVDNDPMPTRGGLLGPSPGPARPRGPRDHEGKTATTRAREANARHAASRRTDPDAAWLRLSALGVRIAQLTGTLQAVDLAAADPADDMTREEVTRIYDHLLALAPWLDRSLSALQRWQGEAGVRARIAKLRAVEGRPEVEAAASLRLADRLERKLGAILTAGSGAPE